MILSAARSQLSIRCWRRASMAGTWDRAIDGDVMSLEGRSGSSCTSLRTRRLPTDCARLDIHPTGPLCGRPAVPCRSEADAKAERTGAGRGAGVDRRLTRLGLDADRRAFRLVVSGLDVAMAGRFTAAVVSSGRGGLCDRRVAREIVCSPDADETDPDS